MLWDHLSLTWTLRARMRKVLRWPTGMRTRKTLWNRNSIELRASAMRHTVGRLGACGRGWWARRSYTVRERPARR